MLLMGGKLIGNPSESVGLSGGLWSEDIFQNIN